MMFCWVITLTECCRKKADLFVKQYSSTNSINLRIYRFLAHAVCYIIFELFKFIIITKFNSLFEKKPND